MRKRLRILTLLLLVLSTHHLFAQNKVKSHDGTIVTIPAKPKIVSLGGAITEILYALGMGDAIVGVDVSSTYPEPVKHRTNVGYWRNLNAEAILALQPNLVLTTSEAGPAAVFGQLKKAGIAVVVVDAKYTTANAKAKIRLIAQAVGKVQRGEELVAELERDLAAAEKMQTNIKTTPSVLFIYARGQSLLLASGKNTPADGILPLAKARNAVTQFDGVKPLTSESVVASRPDIILMTTGGMASLGGIDGVLKIPGVALTPAGKSRRIVEIDDLLLLGFSPRCGKAVQELLTILHPEIQK